MKPIEPGKEYPLGEDPVKVAEELEAGGGIRMGLIGRELKENQRLIDQANAKLARQRLAEEKKRHKAEQKLAKELEKEQRARLEAERKLKAAQQQNDSLFDLLILAAWNAMRGRKPQPKPKGGEDIIEGVYVEELPPPLLTDRIDNDPILSQLPKKSQSPIGKLPRRDSSGKKQF